MPTETPQPEKPIRPPVPNSVPVDPVESDNPAVETK